MLPYEEIKDEEKMVKLMYEYNADYNLNTNSAPMELVFFKD